VPGSAESAHNFCAEFAMSTGYNNFHIPSLPVMG
jgi:hypothetical protein